MVQNTETSNHQFRDEKHPSDVDRKRTSPAAFLAASARVGLFPQTPPNISPGASLASLGLFQARDYRIRHARMEDIAALENLERHCWSQALQAPGDELANRLDTFPEGQFVLVLDNTITGVIYSQRIVHADALMGAQSDSVSTLHQAQGPIAQLLAVNIDPQYQERQLGDQLLEFILQYFSVTPGIESVVAVTLCRNYHRQKEMDKNPPLGMEQYIKKRDARGLLHDPILRFHELHGANISGPIPGYRPKDTKNEGFGVLAIYDIRKRRRKEANLSPPSKTNTDLSGKELIEFLEDTIKGVLGKENESAFSPDRPFMEMGLDSADLLQLNEQLSHAFHRKLGATFFFKHNTHQKLVSWFQANSPAKIRPHSSLETAATAPTNNRRQNDIAIIGMACRLPGGINDPQALWELLKNGRHVIGPMPRGRWTWPPGIDPAHEHRGIDQGGFLDDIESFDASFFRISPKEAALMDPQQRILLELAWETLNNGDLCVESQAGSRTGVFIGASGSDYRLLLEQEKIPAQAHMTTGNSMAVLANRISYFFDFNGPNLSIDTACSSSLVAVHEAVQSLRQGQCTQALAGGINLICHPGTSISYYKAGMLSPDGLCRTFGQKANGYVRSEGAAMIMLKPLDRAIADQDFIHAVIKGSACNHGGLATGLTVPNPDQQARLLADAWENAGIPTTSLGYFEAHGTGTSLGDPIEVQGLQDAFAQSTGSQSGDIVHEKSCGLGSVKTNLGHLEAAAGITGLVKTVLCLNRRKLVASLHCEKLNSHIDLTDSPFYVLDHLQPWPEPKGASVARVAGVSSFGFGGTNAHVVLEEFVGPAMETPENTNKKPSPFNRKPHWFSRGAMVTKKVPPIFFMEKKWRSVPLHTSGTKPQEAHGKIAIFSTDETRKLAESIAKHFIQSQIVSLDGPTTPSHNFGGCIHLHGHNTNNDLDHLRLRFQWLQQWIGTGVGPKARGSNDKLTLLGVTQGLEPFRNPAPNLSGASMASLYRTLQSEYSHVRSRHMDILPGGSDDTHTLAGIIAGEFSAQQGPPEICLRDGERYAPILRARPEKQPPGPDLEIPENEVLWITGGTRGLGLLCARHFVSRYNAKRLVLTGREPFPPREQWPSFQTENGSTSQDPKMAKKIEAVKALEAQGVQVRVLGFSLSDEAAMEKYLQEVRQTMGPAAGVIHCAGIEGTDTPAFIRKELEDVHRVLEPKIPGLDQLIAHFNAEPLRFFLLFSSVSAAIPTLAVGRIDYAMANAYMDYLAQSSSHDCPLLSIQWPSWKETGMGEVQNPVYEGTGLVSLSDREGLRILDHVLSHDLGPVIMPAMVNQSLWEPECLLDHKPHPVPTAHAGDPWPNREPNQVPNRKPDPKKSLRPWLTHLFSRELGFDPGDFDPDSQFKDYGADSILLTQVLRRINKKLDPPLAPTTLYEYTTLNTLASHLEEKGPEPIQTPPHHDIKPEAEAPLDIAIVGMSCRFPGAPTLGAYWQLLHQGGSALARVPDGRWQTTTPFHAGLIEEITHFDASFFLLAQEDVQVMDPQGLLILEESLNLFSHAGYTQAEIKGTPTGVFLGARGRARTGAQDLARARNPIIAAGPNYLAANVSQFFDLKGPSLVVDTACASAITAMGLAVNALRNNEIQAALAGGVCLLETDEMHRLFLRRNLLGKEAVFHVFDQRAAGVIPSEGVGLVLLKTLSQAQKDGDTIYAVIKGLALNNDGRTPGPATPNIQAQKEVMARGLRQSGKSPEEISYIEVNGSGSEVTDLLELKALEAVYGPKDKTPCALGSMKPNIGHPLCAEGMAGFIKLVSMLERKQHVPFLSGRMPMSHYDMASSPFTFVRESGPWQAENLTGALNCFADGGTNAHVIVEAFAGNRHLDGLRRPLTPPMLKKTRIHRGTSNPWAGPLDSHHPVLANHQAFGKSLLPGMAYIDMLYQHFHEQGQGYTGLELHNLSIFQPLLAENKEVAITIHSVETEPGLWKVEVKSGNKRTATAQMRQQAPRDFQERIDPVSIENSCRKPISLDEFYLKCRERKLVHNGFMKAKGTIYASADADIIRITLPPDARSGDNAYLFHPTLLDAGAIGSGGLFPRDTSDTRLFLPLFFQSFRAVAPLRGECFVRIKASSRSETKELIQLDMEFFDVSGTKIAGIKNFKNKCVRNPGLLKTPAPARPVAAPVPAKETTVNDIQEILLQTVASFLNCLPGEIDPGAGYYELGLDSALLLEMVDKLEQTLSVSLSPTLLFEYTSIRELAAHLSTLAGPTAKHAAGGPKPVVHAACAAPKIPAENTPPTEPVGSTSGDIAIIGLAGRYPGADGIDAFWENLKQGKDCITPIPKERWPREIWGDLESPTGKKMSQWGGFIQDADCFDPHYFHISPREAETMDPQERLFLEVCTEAIADAGYTPGNLVSPRGRRGRRQVGVFAGVMHNDYALIGAQAVDRGGRFPLSLNCSPIANRVSYVHHFHGPSMAVDTVCSSSLTAVHLAIQSLGQGESEVALAGGVNLSLHPGKYLTYGLMGMHASTGRCLTFGEGGDGYVSGEGIGAVLLKPLDQALAHRDHIYAVIKGSAVNHGGKTSGFTVPNPAAHADVIEQCLERARIDPRTISYIEAHGTGTTLGDPIEIQGLVKAFAEYTQDKQFCSIGSVKSNIGHAESAAGISGLTKLALQLKHKTLVPSLHSETVNPLIDVTASPFFIQHRTEAWNRPEIMQNGSRQCPPRRAGLSSFGAYGANAHLILEESPVPEAGHITPDTGEGDYLIPLSAKTRDRLHAYAGRLNRFLARTGSGAEPLRLQDIAYTLQTGRQALEERVIFLVKNRQELREKLQAFESGQTVPGLHSGSLKDGKKFNQLLGPDDVRELAGKWMAQGQAAKVAQLWVQGVDLDWDWFHDAQEPPCRISLPPYPFAKERYWIPSDQPDTPIQTPTPADTSLDKNAQTLLLAPVWKTIPLPGPASLVLAPTDRVAVMSRNGEGAKTLKKIYPQAAFLPMDSGADDELKDLDMDHLIWVVPPAPLASLGDETIIKSQDGPGGLFPFFRMIKALLALGYGNRELRLTLITTQTLALGQNDEANPTHAGLHGFLGSIAREYPLWQARLMDLDAAMDWPVRQFPRLPFDAGAPFVYRNKEWYQSQLVPFRSTSQRPPYRHQGVYVVIGGAGGLGEAWSKLMIQQYRARIVWIGRRPMDSTIQGKLDALARLGHAPIYVPADAGNQESLQTAYHTIKQIYPRIHGVVHSAVGVFDQSMATMDEKHFREILSVKVDVSVRLARVFQKETLDMVLFFSSIAAWEKRAGMSGYSAGSTFKDAFALQLSNAWNCMVKVMNWGNWDLGTGKKIPESTKIRLRQNGIYPIDIHEGFKALDSLLTSPLRQMAVLKTSDPKELDAVSPKESLTDVSRTIAVTPGSLSKVPMPSAEPEILESACVFQHAQMADPLMGLLAGILNALDLLHKINDHGSQSERTLGFYRRWLVESRKILAEGGMLSNVSGQSPAHPLDRLWDQWDEVKVPWMRDPNLKPAVVLVETCLRALPDIFAGKTKATEVMFPQASMVLVEGLYQGNLVADYFNKILGNAMASVLKQGQDPVKIFEIGAGTGGTTVSVLPKLRPWQGRIREYCYTDISKAFLFHGEEHFALENPFVRTMVFNVETPLAKQDLDLGQYDMVLATNVLHATRNIRKSLRNAKALLKKGGLLFLNEICKKSLYTHLTFGLLEGWWRNEDDALRIPGCPALSPQAWQRVLQEEGFSQISFPAKQALDLGQQIIVAQSDGLIRQENHSPGPAPSPVKTAHRPAQAGKEQESLHDKGLAYFKDIVGNALKIDPKRLDPAEPLETYGVDSILIGQISSVLGKFFDGVKSTMFFEIRSIDEMLAYFLENHGQRLEEIVFPDTAPDTETVAAQARVNATEKAAVTVREKPPATVRANTAPKNSEPIAVIGMSGRFPGGENLADFWENLKTGRSCIGHIPADRWPVEGFYEPNPDKAVAQGKSFCKWGGFVEGFADFDPLFFHISARDAMEMDPQGRLLLQECWRAFEDAGCVPSRLDTKMRERTGVYCGITKVGFKTSFAALVNRISHAMDLQGPSIPVDTMCASGLTALHQACQELRQSNLKMALVGAVNLYVTPQAYIDLCRARLLADTPRPEVFGAHGKGFVPSEGVGAVVLKRLSDAERDHDSILAVIRGSAVRHGGRTNGYGVPDPRQQAAAIRDALQNADLDPGAINYFESAANGSNMADAIEMAAVAKAFSGLPEDREGFRLGTLKSSMGHGESVSGMAQFMKVVLMLKHKKLCPVVPVPEKHHPDISFESLPFKLQTQLEQWPAPAMNGQKIPRRAGINSMGAGGINTHLILEEYNPPKTALAPSVYDHSLPVLFILSAKSKVAFTQYLLDWQQYIDSHPGTDLFRLAYTLQTGREPMKYRFACLTRDTQELSAALKAAAKGNHHDGCYTGQADLPSRDTADIESWLHDKNLDQLARGWVKGAPVPWTHWYRDNRPRPLNHLPTYPFVRKTYWHAPPVAGPPVVETENKSDPVRQRIRSIVNKILEFDEGDEIDDQMIFSQMGFSSITIVTFIEEVNRKFNLELRPTTAFDYPTIHELTRHVAKKAIQWKPSAAPKVPDCKDPKPEEPAPKELAPTAAEDGLDAVLRDFAAGKLDEEQTLSLIGN